MNNKYVKFSLSVIASAAIVVSTLSNASGPGGDRTGAPGSSGNCSACHGGSAALGGDIAMNIVDKITSSVVTSYVAGKTYTIGIKMGGTSTRKGFNATVLNASNAGVGSISNNSTGTTVYTSGNRSIVSHNTPGLGLWYFDWTAPATATGTITFYGAGIVSNMNNNNTGDQVVSTSMAIPAAISNVNNKSASPISLYPNPTSSEIHFGQALIKIQIFNALGKEVFNGSDISEMSVENFKSGNYRICGITQSGKSFNSQFIKQ